jgi:hypothetical protein
LKLVEEKMENQIYKSIWTLALWLLMFFCLGFGQTKAEVYPVDISHDTLGWHITPCPLPGVTGDTWRFSNSASDTISVFIVSPVCGRKQNPRFYILAPGDSVDHLIGAGDGRVAVTLLHDGWVAHCGRIVQPTCPILTQWGTITLVLSLIGATSWILLRRKKRLA